jgi:hypothetical protein
VKLLKFFSNFLQSKRIIASTKLTKLTYLFKRLRSDDGVLFDGVFGSRKQTFSTTLCAATARSVKQGLQLTTPQTLAFRANN